MMMMMMMMMIVYAPASGRHGTTAPIPRERRASLVTAHVADLALELDEMDDGVLSKDVLIDEKADLQG